MFNFSEFLAKNGVSLMSAGSAELAITPGAALELLGALSEQGRDVYGIEVWRPDRAGFEIDSLAGWYSTGDRAFDFNDARGFLNDLEPGVRVTVQFSKV